MKSNYSLKFGATFCLTTVASALVWGQSNYEPYTFTTLAGEAGDAGSADGAGTAARFSNPNSVSVDNAGNIYVADWGDHTIRKVGPDGTVSTLAGLAGNAGFTNGKGSAARFKSPGGVAVDRAGNVYVADTGNSLIRKVSAAGVVSTLSGTEDSRGSTDGASNQARFGYPNGVAVDSAGIAYVTEPFNNTIRRVNKAGYTTTLAGLAGAYGSRDGTGSAARFGASGAGSGPQGIAVDNAGILYVADTGNGTIRRVTSAGVVTTLAGEAGSFGSTDGPGSTSRFGRGLGNLAVDNAGNVYVADYGNHVIRKLTLVGTNWMVRTVAGLAGTPGSSDGKGSNALFHGPNGVAVDSAGNLYVAEYDNQTIRKGLPALVIAASGGNLGFSGREFGFNLAGSADQIVLVEASTDLVTWLPVWTNTLIGAPLRFSDPQSGVHSGRFYRARAR